MHCPCLLLLFFQATSACWWRKTEEPERRPMRRPTFVRTPSVRPKLAMKRRPGPPKKKRPGPPAPKPTEYVGEKPTWELIPQKGNTCISTSTASVPCKDPIKVGKSCKDKFNWSNEGYIESEVHCLKNKKGGGVIRKEMRRECFYKAGEFQCWKHWSSTGCHAADCQSDKLGNGWTDV